MFQLNLANKKPSSGEIRVPNKSCRVNYIKPLFLSVYIGENSSFCIGLDKPNSLDFFERTQFPHKVITR
jgi:hypothetical protein